MPTSNNVWLSDPLNGNLRWIDLGMKLVDLILVLQQEMWGVVCTACSSGNVIVLALVSASFLRGLMKQPKYVHC